MAGDKTAEMAFELGRLMNEMKYHLRKEIQQKLKMHDLDISFELLEVMSFLWRKDGINQQEIADLALKDKSSMTYVVDNLVRRKLVTRQEDETDRRSKRICLTAAGKQLQKKLNPHVIEAYSDASKGIMQSDIKKSINLVQNMILNIRKKNIV